jgi:hypothetical protein
LRRLWHRTLKGEKRYCFDRAPPGRALGEGRAPRRAYGAIWQATMRRASFKRRIVRGVHLLVDTRQTSRFLRSANRLATWKPINHWPRRVTKEWAQPFSHRPFAPDVCPVRGRQ